MADKFHDARKDYCTCKQCRKAREDSVSVKPEWLYGSGCCDKWTPSDGCPQHTGRQAMSLSARAMG